MKKCPNCGRECAETESRCKQCNCSLNSIDLVTIIAVTGIIIVILALSGIVIYQHINAPPDTKESNIFQDMINTLNIQEISTQAKNRVELNSAQDSIMELFDKNDYKGIIELTDRYIEGLKVDDSTLGFYLIRSAAFRKMGDTNRAVNEFDAVVKYLRTLDNAEQEKFADVFMTQADLYFQQGEYEKAESLYKEGLGLWLQPESKPLYQIDYGYVIEHRDAQRAASYYKELQNDPALSSENRYVVQLRIANISGENTLQAPDLSTYYPSFTIKLVPISGFDSRIDLQDLCLFLQAKYRTDCIVLPAIDMTTPIDKARGQFKSEDVLNELLNILGDQLPQSSLVLAYTGEDIYAEGNNFVFALSDNDHRIGIISSNRFNQTLPVIEEDRVLMRRVAIQSLSSIGRQLGFNISAQPQCPLAYPDSVNAFTLKSTAFCAEEERQLDETLQKYKEGLVLFTEEQKKDIESVYSRYHFE